MGLMIPRKKPRKPPEKFNYPHDFKIGDLVCYKESSHLYRTREGKELATIIDFNKDGDSEAFTILFQSGKTKRLDISVMVVHMVKVS